MAVSDLTIFIDTFSERGKEFFRLFVALVLFTQKDEI